MVFFVCLRLSQTFLLRIFHIYLSTYHGNFNFQERCEWSVCQSMELYIGCIFWLKQITNTYFVISTIILYKIFYTTTMLKIMSNVGVLHFTLRTKLLTFPKRT